MGWGVQGLLTEGFFWIPSLAGPTTIAARQNGSGVSWLFPFVVSNPELTRDSLTGGPNCGYLLGPVIST
jgi:hypothetical protein